jgi:threonine dehydratase
MDILEVQKEALRAEDRIRPHVRETILEPSPYLSELGGAQVYCKLENLQHTGSFKVRGVMNRLLSMTREELSPGLVTASTGNHGAALAYATSRLGAVGIVYAPENADPDKLSMIERLGVEVRFHGDDNAVAEIHARRYAAENGMTYVSPYNDPLVVGGQGTIAVELERQLDRVDIIFVSLGGGGLISGVAGYLKSVNPEAVVVGCSPENSQVMIQSIRAGEILDLPSLPTLSDGTAGGVEPGAITFDLCRELVDDFVTVSEDEIADALRLFMKTHHMLIEGAAAVAVASYLKMLERCSGKQAVIVICGANISLETLKSAL